LELLKGFIANQKGELELKQKELDIRAEENKASSTFAHASLDAMAKDREQGREATGKTLISTYIFLESLFSSFCYWGLMRCS